MSSSVPVIDFSPGKNVPSVRASHWEPSDEEKALGTQLIRAFQTVGFVCLINTGISDNQISSMIDQVKDFFTLPHEVKVKYNKQVMSNVGWTDVARENLNPEVRKVGDFKETFNYQPTMDGEILPKSMTVLDDWWKIGSKLTYQVLRLMGLGLGLINPSVIAESHEFGSQQNESAIRVNFYPKTADKCLSQDQVRCGEHSDYGSITLLIQDSQGLEVMNRQTGKYESVEAPPGGVIVNVGDMMQRWTSDDLVANLHRVLVAQDPVLSSQDRVSVPFFAMPDQDTVIKCLLGRDKYEPVTMKDWLKMRIDEAFKERQGDLSGRSET